MRFRRDSTSRPPRWAEWGSLVVAVPLAALVVSGSPRHPSPARGAPAREASCSSLESARVQLERYFDEAYLKLRVISLHRDIVAMSGDHCGYVPVSLENDRQPRHFSQIRVIGRKASREHSRISCSGTPLSSPLRKGGNREVTRYTDTESALERPCFSCGRIRDLKNARAQANPRGLRPAARHTKPENALRPSPGQHQADRAVNILTSIPEDGTGDTYSGHLQRFAKDPTLESLLGGPAGHRLPEPPLVLSVPVRSNGELIGIVSGTVLRDTVLKMLRDNAGNHHGILASERGDVLGHADPAPDTRERFQSEFRAEGVSRFLEDCSNRFGTLRSSGVWCRLDIPGDPSWYLAMVPAEAGDGPADSLATGPGPGGGRG